MTAGECAFKEKKVKFLQDVLGDEIEEYLKAFENPNAKTQSHILQGLVPVANAVLR